MNAYGRQLSADEIARGDHRAFVGGLWEELGRLQLDYLVRAGLLPHHQLLDVGCGALRGGVHFVRYLQADRYCGLDVNASLLAAGAIELTREGLADRGAQLLADPQFSVSRFGRRFDRAVAVSVFTHLPMNVILRCLHNVAAALAEDGVFHATYFDAPASIHLEPITHQPGGITTQFDADPFHYSRDEIRAMAQGCGLDVSFDSDWGHPRAQVMANFRLAH
jgi:cyclopropane fatty-acyl-phospholipid synthase-like methyltransferase